MPHQKQAVDIINANPTATEHIATVMRKVFTLFLIVIVLIARLLPGALTIDDAFITYRYAQNLLASNGFTYNVGERVLVTTTPLYTLLIASVAALSGGTQAPFPKLAVGINATADSLSCLLLWQTGR